MKPQIKFTEDGSTTLYREDLKEHYHSIHGAVQEAIHVYINAGFKTLSNEQNRILEIGFGTGLNALLTCEAATQLKKNIIYHSIEKHILDESLTSKLNFGEEKKEMLKILHSAPCNKEIKITPYFTLRKIEADLLSFQFTEQYDLIYYDAFAPDKQPEMWTQDIINKVTDALSNKGIITTYSTKGTVKQAFRNAGLFVKRLPGPPGKRDMLRCLKM